MSATIAQRVLALIAEFAGVSALDVTSATRLDDGERGIGLDSLDKAELLMEIEAHFSVCIDDDEIGELITAGEIVAIVERHSEAISS